MDWARWERDDGGSDFGFGFDSGMSLEVDARPARTQALDCIRCDVHSQTTRARLHNYSAHASPVESKQIN